MKLSLGISPCPNDTYIFDAWVNGKIDTQGLEIDLVLADVEQLNEWAMEGKLDVTKFSYGAWPLLHQQYQLLNSGSALGKGVGPLLVGASPLPAAGPLVTLLQQNLPVALPGQHTTAHYLFQQAFPSVQHKSFLSFDGIENAVVAGDAIAGVIIHESRFTYAEKGLHRWADLGAFWEEKTNLPLPLGGIAAHKRLSNNLVATIDALVAASLRYAHQQGETLSDFVKDHAQEMSEQVMRQHIGLYVNDFSLGLGTDGKKAIATLTGIPT
ncbi:MAG: 1,4-dihydroxy-6-naphthoate synthase [Sphingobacteriia bacterium]|nr:MAG: 1,4-dihydroxy-6-naphthoate synthase [Sphingobacteriia bacterium]